MVKVYILGEARGAHRIQGFIKLLLDDRKNYKVYYDSLFYSNRLLRYLKSLLINPLVILRSDVVYVCTLNVDVNIFYELLWAKLLRKKVIVDFYVSVFDTVVLDRKWFKEGGVMAKLALLCDKMFLFLSDKCVFTGETEEKYWLKTVGYKGKLDSICIPLGIPERPRVKGKFINGERESMNICWWGSYQPLHGLENILQAVRILKDQDLPVHCFFFGNNIEKERYYLNIAKENGVAEMCMFSCDYTFANDKLPRFLEENCDIALGQFGTSEKAKLGPSNKVLEACSMRCVVLTKSCEGMNKFFGDSVFVSESTPEDIAQKILEIYYSDKEVLKKKAEQAYSCYLQTFTVEKMTQRMKNLINQIKQ